MARFDITSANSKLVMTVEELYPSGIALQQFAADSSFVQDDTQVAETRMGVDGYMVAGMIPSIKVVTIKLESCSPSFDALAEVWSAIQKNMRPFECALVATCPSIGRTFTWSVGTMYSGIAAPAAMQVFEPTTWVFHFSNFAVSKSTFTGTTIDNIIGADLIVPRY